MIMCNGYEKIRSFYQICFPSSQMTQYFPIKRMLLHFHNNIFNCHITTPFVKMTIFKKIFLESYPLQTVYEAISSITEANNATVFSENQVVFEEDDYIRMNIYSEGSRIQELVEVTARITTVFDQAYMVATTEARFVFYEDELY